MGTLSVHHPDILEFISCKESGDFSNFNISISMTDNFMNAVIKNKNYSIIDPVTKNKVKELSARNVFNTIATQAWKTGDPGLVFIDEINKKHSLNEIIESTNACGEQPLLPWESCVLGSINLEKFVIEDKIDWNRLSYVIKSSVHFLDNIIDLNYYISKKIEEKTKANRKIGLGVMGWANMLIKLKIKYSSNKALRLGEKIMKFISNEADSMSVELAKFRGSFPNFNKSRLNKKFKYIRNGTRTTIAPTGIISLIANETSSGIEPIFAVSYIRNFLEENKFIEVNKLFEELAIKRNFYSEELMYNISKKGSIQNFKEIPKDVRDLFVTALDINYESHIKMQSVFQKYTDNSISKTINMLQTSSIEDVKNAYLLAYKLKCKGITIFRYGSKEKQVLYFNEHITVEPEFSGGCPGLECGH